MNSQNVPFARRLRKPLVLASLSMVLSAMALPAAATTWWSATPQLSIGSARISVRTKGAVGNGVHDDTAAFQAAVNSLPSTGGTVVVPAGTYMINATRSINLRSHVRLALDPNAVIKAIPTSASRYYIVRAYKVNNVEITGGRIMGERARHKGTYGEWGYGINVSGSAKVYVHDIKVSDCWGDGVLVGGVGSGTRGIPSSDVTLNRVASDNNRRQGLSILPVNRIYVVNSSFTNSHGTKPEAGIDIEPMTQGWSQHIRIEKSTLNGNHGNGLEVHDYVRDLVVKSSRLDSNHGNGALLINANYGWLAKNEMSQNGIKGAALHGSTNGFRVVYNTMQYNGANYYLSRGLSIFTHSTSGLSRDIDISRTTYNISVSGNTYSP